MTEKCFDEKGPMSPHAQGGTAQESEAIRAYLRIASLTNVTFRVPMKLAPSPFRKSAICKRHGGGRWLFWHDPLRDERHASRGWISVKRLPVLGLFTNVSLDIG
jgi:hypothetical protein